MDDLGRILSKEGRFRPILNEFSFSRQLRFDWVKVVGALSEHLSVSHVHRGTLFLEASNYMWVTEIGFYRDQLLEKISQSFPKSRIKKVEVSYVKKEVHSQTSLGDNFPIGMGFEEKIRREVERKLALGYRLCRSCGDVYALEPICVFCRVSMALG
jgi:hypothetical protein